MSSILRVSNFFSLSFVVLYYVTLVDAAPTTRRHFIHDGGIASTTGFQTQNGLDAQVLDAQFVTLSTSDPCQDGSMACVNRSFAQCISGKWALTPCPSGLQCYAIPLVKSPGTSLAYDTQQDALARIAATGGSSGLTGSSINDTTTLQNDAPTNGSATDLDDDGDCTDDPPHPPTSGNSSPSTGGTMHEGNATTYSTDADTDDCDDDGYMTSSMRAMATPASSHGNVQLYRRQNTTGSSDRATIKKSQLSQAFPVTPSPSPTPSPSANSSNSVSSTLSSPANTSTALTQTPVTPLPSTASTGQASIMTITLIMVSTVTVTPTDCQPGVTTRLSSGSSSLPTNSVTLTSTTSPSNLSSSPPAVTSSPSSISNPVTSIPASEAPSTPTPSSNSATTTINTITGTNANTGTPLATPSQSGIFFSTQNNFVRPTAA